MSIHARVAPLAMAAALLGGGLATASTASAASDVSGGAPAAAAAQSCYGGAKNYKTTESGIWPGGGVWSYATTRCADINVKPTTTRKVRVCWKRTGTCNAYRTAKAGQWTVAASNVRDGAGFSLDFKGIGVSKGKVAA